MLPPKMACTLSKDWLASKKRWHGLLVNNSNRHRSTAKTAARTSMCRGRDTESSTPPATASDPTLSASFGALMRMWHRTPTFLQRGALVALDPVTVTCARPRRRRQHGSGGE